MRNRLHYVDHLIREQHSNLLSNSFVFVISPDFFHIILLKIYNHANIIMYNFHILKVTPAVPTP